jgi:hypothetical protein
MVLRLRTVRRPRTVLRPRTNRRTVRLRTNRHTEVRPRLTKHRFRTKLQLTLAALLTVDHRPRTNRPTTAVRLTRDLRPRS